MELLNFDFINEHSLKILQNLSYDQQLDPLKCLEVLVDDTGKFTDAYLFDNEYFYAVICHCLDINLYCNDVLVNLCKQYCYAHKKTKLRSPKPYFFVISKPMIYSTPITENSDLKELFDLFVYDMDDNFLNFELKDIKITPTADLLIRKYATIEDVINDKGSVVINFNEQMNYYSMNFYNDMLAILLKNKEEPLLIKIIDT